MYLKKIPIAKEKKRMRALQLYYIEILIIILYNKMRKYIHIYKNWHFKPHALLFWTRIHCFIFNGRRVYSNSI